jgi:uncharacterized protein DUF4338
VKSNARANGRQGAQAASLRRAVHERLVRVGFQKNGHGYFIPGTLTKDTVRRIHGLSRRARRDTHRPLIDRHGKHLVGHFADGVDVVPARIDPELVLVRSGTEEANLFRIATLLWSVPVSQGFGRRLRFLVRDRQNGKLIGLFGLTDPVFNLAARDEWIGWSVADRRERLVRVMDAFVVGAVPPYAQLIGGKLVAALMTSAEVMMAYDRKYNGVESVISQRVKPSKLVLLTTTSALGRSSLYNRLRIPGGARFEHIGGTKGFGHFHLSGHLFDRLRSRLTALKHPYSTGHQFGMGPNWRLRVVREALESLGLEADSILRHGIQREIFAAPLAQNWQGILKGEHVRVRAKPLSAAAIAEYCIARWILPRSARDTSYQGVRRESILAAIKR